MSRTKKVLIGLAVAAVWLALWQGIHMAIGVGMLFPSPWHVIMEMGRMFVTSDFWITIGLTVLRVNAGFLLGCLFGGVLAVLSHRSRVVNWFLAPLMYIVKSTPVASFIVLALIWLEKETAPSFICMLIVLPIVFGNILSGLQAVDRDLLEMSRVFGFSFGKRLRCVYLPAIRSHVTAAAGTGLGIAWKASIAAEAISRPAMSIGNAIIESKLTSAFLGVFAWTAYVILLSVLFDQLLKLVTKRTFARRERGGVTA